MSTFIVHAGGTINIGQQIDTYNDYRGSDKTTPHPEAEDAVVIPDSPSFFCTERYEHDSIAREILHALKDHHTKVDKCRELYRLERLGYISFRNCTDQQKADALNAYQSDYHFSRDDFRNAR